MRTLTLLFGLAVLGGLVAMAVAGYPGAVGFLATGGGIVAMIVLGVRFGGRHGAPARPQRPPSDAPAPGDPPAGQ